MEGLRSVKCAISSATAPLDSTWPLKPEGTATLFKGKLNFTAFPLLGVMVMVEVLLVLGADAQSTVMTARTVEVPEG